jgi:N6-adenosine-specific RNA methylase IME4
MASRAPRRPVPFWQRYDVLLCDPPWRYLYWSPEPKGGRAMDHYPLMDTDRICALGPLVRDLVADDCVLLLWATQPKLEDALRVAREWGFAYKTMAFVWVKLARAHGRPTKGMGHWTRSNAEFCLLATRGRPKRHSYNVDEVILSHRGRHSEKPGEQYARIGELLHGPRLELFARRVEPGWVALGNELDGLDIFDSLALLKRVPAGTDPERAMTLMAEWANVLHADTERVAS